VPENNNYGALTLARTHAEHPTAFIENTKLFGDLAQNDQFVAVYLEALESLHAVGAHATVTRYAELEGTPA